MIESLVSLLVLLIVVGLVLWLIIWAIDMLPLPAPFGQVAKVIVVLICVLIVLFYALPLIGISIG